MRPSLFKVAPALAVVVTVLLCNGIFQAVFVGVAYLAALVVANISAISTRHLEHVSTHPSKPDYVLETFPLSPFVEKVRWVLDKLNVNYAEEPDLGVMMLFRGGSVPALHFGGGSWALSTISNSADIIAYLRGRFGHESAARFLHVDDAATASKIEALGDRLCEVARRLFYYHVLVHDGGRHAPFLSIMIGGDDPRVPAWQRRLAPLFRPVQAFLLKRVFRLNSPTCREKCVAQLHSLTTQLEQVLAASSHNTFMNTAEPSYVDYCVAASVGCFSFNTAYSNGNCRIAGEPQRIRDELPELARDFEQFSTSTLATWTKELYENKRN
eukprot:TRINITY_DN1183_c0_g1_i3.p1 TRINITY_DN1183_c0_g1~~TRINITY_DN1183_c0_g1_i3.p1  ORF type:complete len:326 (-),score=65.67 TRINITY_DN1183_c0_g1_i3:26-1003(-)